MVTIYGYRIAYLASEIFSKRTVNPAAQQSHRDHTSEVINFGLTHLTNKVKLSGSFGNKNDKRFFSCEHFKIHTILKAEVLPCPARFSVWGTIKI